MITISASSRGSRLPCFEDRDEEPIDICKSQKPEQRVTSQNQSWR
jgi:hypothetical protein